MWNRVRAFFVPTAKRTALLPLPTLVHVSALIQLSHSLALFEAMRLQPHDAADSRINLKTRRKEIKSFPEKYVVSKREEECSGGRGGRAGEEKEGDSGGEEKTERTSSPHLFLPLCKGRIPFSAFLSLSLSLSLSLFSLSFPLLWCVGRNDAIHLLTTD